MSELLHTLGINGKLLLAQAGNFLVLLLVLRFAVYKPLLSLMKERRERIEFGLKGADEAEKKLNEIEKIKEEKLKEADQQALIVIAESDKEAKKRFSEVVSGAEKKADYMLKEAASIAKQREIEEMELVYQKANEVIKEALIKTVQLDPSQVDEKLISSAIKSIKAK